MEVCQSFWYTHPFTWMWLCIPPRFGRGHDWIPSLSCGFNSNRRDPQGYLSIGQMVSGTSSITFIVGLYQYWLETPACALQRCCLIEFFWCLANTVTPIGTIFLVLVVGTLPFHVIPDLTFIILLIGLPHLYFFTYHYGISPPGYQFYIIIMWSLECRRRFQSIYDIIPWDPLLHRNVQGDGGHSFDLRGLIVFISL